ncbi:unnamed protein product [Ambrosiozyma monospora]|uniref:Unnamed protein product n=1 Tax=Ambrosiozyma monospora TaxID=43982 RepID=A0ACB5TQR3_AMBMO|nr:unnamed protein product [Ambrosiozyma monospora]
MQLSDSFVTQADLLLEFWNTTQTRTSSKSIKVTLQSLISSLLFSVGYLAIQFILYCALRSKFKYFYEPLLYCLPKHYSNQVRKLGENPLRWFKIVSGYSIGFYYRWGLDEYYFMRMLHVLLQFFVGLCCVSIPILIPVNYFGGVDHASEFGVGGTGGGVISNGGAGTFPLGGTRVKLKYDHSAAVQLHEVAGLDVLSTSNISPSQNNRYLVHFILAIFVICWYHYMLTKELGHCARERKLKVLSRCRNKSSRDKLSVLFVDNVPCRLNTVAKLKSFLKNVPGGVDAVWAICDFAELDRLVKRFEKYRTLLEELIVKEMIMIYKTGQIDVHSTALQPFKLVNGIETVIPLLSKQVDAFELYTEKLQSLSTQIVKLQMEFAKKDQDPNLLVRKAFIKFKKPHGAYIAQQLLLSGQPGEMANTMMVKHSPSQLEEPPSLYFLFV